MEQNLLKPGVSIVDVLVVIMSSLVDVRKTDTDTEDNDIDEDETWITDGDEDNVSSQLHMVLHLSKVEPLALEYTGLAFLQPISFLSTT